MARLPIPGEDNDQWGDVLNGYLAQEHTPVGSHSVVHAEDVVAKGPIVDARAFAGLDQAIAAVDGQERTLLVCDAQAAAPGLVVPRHVSLFFARGGRIVVAGGASLTIEGTIQAGPYQIFEFDSGAEPTLVIKNNNVQAHWFPGIDIGQQIDRANRALFHGGAIWVEPGQYSFSTPFALFGGRMLRSGMPGRNNDLDFIATDVGPNKMIYDGPSPMCTLRPGGDSSEGSTQMIEGFTFATTESGTYTKTAIAVGADGTDVSRSGVIQHCQFNYWATAIDLNPASNTNGQVFNIKHNTIRRCNRGIHVNGADHVIIAYNRLIDCKDELIRVGDAGTYSVWIDHNNCAQAGSAYGDGFVIDRAVQINITFNHVETLIAKPGARCIKINGVVTCLMANILGNFLNFNSQTHAVELSGDIRGLNVQGNDFHGGGADECVAAIDNNAGANLHNGTALANVLHGSDTKPVVDDTRGFVMIDAAGYLVNRGLWFCKFDGQRPPNVAEDGMLAYANGTSWNPGGGAGFYGRVGGAWVKLG
jgi:hypothetical protein